MQIIKDKKIVDDHWSFVADDNPLPDSGDITVSFIRWNSEREKLLNHSGHLGIRLSSEDDLDAIRDDLSHFQLIELYFPVFTDGRCFSLARMLRNRYHYQGEIRACGHFMRDQLFYLWRVGFNSFNPEDIQDLKNALQSLNDFTVSYQESSR